jgi:hypothetical protein
MNNGYLWAGIIVDILVIFLVFVIARRYHWFWHVLLQMDEPFTRWFCRIAQAHPLLWWGAIGTFAVTSFITTIFAPWSWRILGMVASVFMGWFVPHIRDYIKTHPENTPDPPEADGIDDPHKTFWRSITTFEKRGR